MVWLSCPDFTSYVRDEVLRGPGFKCTGGIMASEAISLFRSFYEQGNPNGISIAQPLLHIVDFYLYV